jgi:hypothetical protein
LLAQFRSGNIIGTVSDSSGGLVPGVQVAVTSKATGIVTTVPSLDTGAYRLERLDVGMYRLTAEKTGFQTYVAESVEVEVGVTRTLDITLVIGSVTQQINVVASSVELNTTNADAGVVLTPRTVEDLPLEVAGQARDISTFQFLAPGVTGNTFSHRINGGVDFNQEVVFDGVPWADYESQGYTEPFSPPYDAVDEFNITTSVFSSQYGNSQGVISYHMRTGGSKLHGSHLNSFATML